MSINSAKVDISVVFGLMHSNSSTLLMAKCVCVCVCVCGSLFVSMAGVAWVRGCMLVGRWGRCMVARVRCAKEKIVNPTATEVGRVNSYVVINSRG